jgi:hypothetical protein
MAPLPIGTNTVALETSLLGAACWTKLVVWTIIAFQQVIAIGLFAVNLMQASSLSADGTLVAATKAPKVQDEKFRVFNVASEITLRRQIRPTHSR